MGVNSRPAEQAFGTRRAQAERMKCFHGSANMSPRDNHDMIEVKPIAEDDVTEGSRITRAQLIAVIRVLAEMLPDPGLWQSLAAIGWLLAFAPWVLRHAGIYLRPRIDGKPG